MAVNKSPTMKRVPTVTELWMDDAPTRRRSGSPFGFKSKSCQHNAVKHDDDELLVSPGSPRADSVGSPTKFRPLAKGESMLVIPMPDDDDLSKPTLLRDDSNIFRVFTQEQSVKGSKLAVTKITKIDMGTSVPAYVNQKVLLSFPDTQRLQFPQSTSANIHQSSGTLMTFVSNGDMYVGDAVRAGEVLTSVSSPRLACGKTMSDSIRDLPTVSASEASIANLVRATSPKVSIRYSSSASAPGSSSPKLPLGLRSPFAKKKPRHLEADQSILRLSEQEIAAVSVLSGESGWVTDEEAKAITDRRTSCS